MKIKGPPLIYSFLNHSCKKLISGKLMSFSSLFGNLVFGYFVATKLPKFLLLLFLLSKARQAKRKFKVKKITQPK
jgi:hypothetical protein